MISIRPYLGNRQFYKNILFIALPIAMQSLITIGVSLMGNIMVGQLGETQISAAHIAISFVTLYQICCMGIGMGASVMTSRFWGTQSMESLKKAVTIMLRISFTFGLVFTAVTFFIPDSIMGIYTQDAEVIAAGVRYFRWAVPCYWLLGFSLHCTIVLRSVGQVRIPLICSIFAFFINIFFSWMFIYGNLGAPRLEIEGASIGVFIARIFEFSFICGYFLFVDKKIGYRIKNIFIKCGDMFREYLRIGIPVLVSDLLLAIGNNVVTIVMGLKGKYFLSAVSVIMVVVQLSTVFVQGLANSSSIITGHTLGAGDIKKAKADGFTFWLLAGFFGILAGIIIRILAPAILGLYKIEPETVEIAKELMAIVSIMIIFQAMDSVLTKGVLRGGGDTLFLMVADVLFLWVASIPLGYLAVTKWGFPPFWIFFFLRIDQVFKATWCIFRLFSGKWIKKI